MVETSKIRVLIIDDHGMVRRGLKAYLKHANDIEIVAEGQNGREAIELCKSLMPDVVLMDLMMPELNGVAATRKINELWPQIQVIALTSFQEKELVQDAIQAGAISYILKNVSGEDLADAIRSANSGFSTLAPEAVQLLIRSVDERPKIGDDLTRREREVLNLLVKGLNNPEIADHLHITRSTAKAHVSNILSKFGVTNRGEAIALAIKHHLTAGQ
jgi:DNA-binding NarL/FixJ family response regulator